MVVHYSSFGFGEIMANSKRKCAYCKKRVRDYIVVNTQAFCSFESVVKYANENPENLHWEAALIANLAFTKAFPCEKS